MPRECVEQLLYLLDEAFEADQWHSLLSNLTAVEPEDWMWVPPNGQRSIRDIVEHVGVCKIMYENHAFGDGALRWDSLVIASPAGLTSKSSAFHWLREAQDLLRSSIAKLDDAELLRPRKTNWGEMRETRWIIAMMVQHDLYHAGEINHIRSLHHHKDNWAYESSP